MSPGSQAHPFLGLALCGSVGTRIKRPGPPDLVILGSSRAGHIEPAYAMLPGGPSAFNSKR